MFPWQCILRLYPCEMCHLYDKPIKILHVKVKVKWFRYRPGVAQRVGRGIALLFHERGTRRGWVVSSTPRPHFTPGKDPVRILQEAGWAPGPVWMGGKSRPHRDSIPDRPVRSQLLFQLSYPVHNKILHVQGKNRDHNRAISMGQKHVQCAADLRLYWKMTKLCWTCLH